MSNNKKINDITKKLMKHCVTIKYIQNESTDYAYGILREVTDDYIRLDMCTVFGRIEKCYLNLRVTTILFIKDLGRWKGVKRERRS